MKFVIIIALAFVLLIPTSILAQSSSESIELNELKKIFPKNTIFNEHYTMTSEGQGANGVHDTDGGFPFYRIVINHITSETLRNVMWEGFKEVQEKEGYKGDVSDLSATCVHYWPTQKGSLWCIKDNFFITVESTDNDPKPIMKQILLKINGVQLFVNDNTQTNNNSDVFSEPICGGQGAVIVNGLCTMVKDGVLTIPKIDAESTAQSNYSICPSGEILSTRGYCMTPEPVETTMKNPQCGKGTELVNGICTVIKQPKTETNFFDDLLKMFANLFR